MPGSSFPGSPFGSFFASAVAPLCRADDASPSNVTVSLLYQGDLADSTQIFIVRDAAARPLGIVHLSAKAAPAMVARGTSRARAAAVAVGPVLARSILLPVGEGEIEGRSYSVTPYCHSFAGGRCLWALQRLQLRPLLLDWLHCVATTTRTGVPPADLDRLFRRPIAQARALVGASPRLVACCDRALSRLASGAWTPQLVLMHGDLWRGNLMLRQGAGPAGRFGNWSNRLVLIDWAGANLQGYAFFDLARAADSLRLGLRGLGAEIARHCAVLGCEPVDAAAYVLAAAGALRDDLGEFPVQRLVAMAESSVRLIDDAAAALGPRGPWRVA